MLKNISRVFAIISGILLAYIIVISFGVGNNLIGISAISQICLAFSFISIIADSYKK